MAKITFTIDDNKLEEFKSGFLKENPVPGLAPKEEKQLTEDQWIKEWGRLQYIRAYKRGKRKIAEDTMSLEQEIIN